jgi:hypothetical protein
MSNPTGKGGFQPGQSGNPGGRAKMPPEIRNMLTAKAHEAVQVIANELGNGDPRVALKAAELLLDRAYGKPQAASESIDLSEAGDTSTPDAILKLHSAMLAAAATGKVTLAEAKEFSALLETQRRLIETADLETRLAALERKQQ